MKRSTKKPKNHNYEISIKKLLSRLTLQFGTKRKTTPYIEPFIKKACPSLLNDILFRKTYNQYINGSTILYNSSLVPQTRLSNPNSPLFGIRAFVLKKSINEKIRYLLTNWWISRTLKTINSLKFYTFFIYLLQNLSHSRSSTLKKLVYKIIKLVLNNRQIKDNSTVITMKKFYYRCFLWLHSKPQSTKQDGTCNYYRHV
jgi:hypothetical protein